MEYSEKGITLSDINDQDIKAIISFAKDALAGKTDKRLESNVILLENIGESDGTNPLGIKGENN